MHHKNLCRDTSRESSPATSRMYVYIALMERTMVEGLVLYCPYSMNRQFNLWFLSCFEIWEFYIYTREWERKKRGEDNHFPIFRFRNFICLNFLGNRFPFSQKYNIKKLRFSQVFFSVVSNGETAYRTRDRDGMCKGYYTSFFFVLAI
jgi:hypothetical protein